MNFKNFWLFIKCWKLLLRLYVFFPRGLEELRENIEQIIEYYDDVGTDITNQDVPMHKQVIITARIKETIVRAPLIIDTD